MIDPGAVLVPGSDAGPPIAEVIVGDTGTRNVGHQLRRPEGKVVLRHRAETVLWNLVTIEGSAGVGLAIRAQSGGTRIVELHHEQLAVRTGLFVVAEIAVIHLRQRNSPVPRRVAAPVAEPFVGGEEERLVPAVVELRQVDRTSKREPEIVLLEDGSALGEKAARIGGVVAHELEDVAMYVVASRLGGEGNDPHGAAVFGLHSRALHAELGDCVHRNRADRRALGLVLGRAAGDRRAVHAHLPSGALSAADPVAAFRLHLGRDQGQVEHTTDLPGDHQGQILHQFVGQAGGHAGGLGLQR